jgi:hypothetical protein
MTNMRRNLQRRLWRLAHPPRAGPFQRMDSAASSEALLLHIPTSDGSGQACHPSIAYSPSGIGGFRYWMANTPYSGNSHKLENPELFASHDGLFWQIPPGLNNPVVPPPPGDDRHYHSDPCLVIHQRRLHLYFRTSDEQSRPRRDWLSLMASEDGRRWTAPQRVIEARGSLLLSPSVRVIEGRYRMWTVEAEPDSGRLMLANRESREGINWSPRQWSKIDWAGPPMEPWHIEVIETGSELAMMLSARDPGRPGTQKWKFLLGDGLNWRELELDFGDGCFFEAGKPYKPSLLSPTEDSPSGWLYTSSTDPQGCWYTALRPGPFRP